MSISSSQLRKELVALLPRLRRFALSLTSNGADGDDLLQAAIERVLAKTPPEDVALDRWMFRVIKNIWIDEIRARKVRSDDGVKQAIDLHDRPDGVAEIEGRTELAQVQRLMQKLPDEQRLVLLLIPVEGYSYKEASEILDIPTGTVMSRLARARAALASLLDTGDGAMGEML